MFRRVGVHRLHHTNLIDFAAQVFKQFADHQAITTPRLKLERRGHRVALAIIAIGPHAR